MASILDVAENINPADGYVTPCKDAVLPLVSTPPFGPTESPASPSHIGSDAGRPWWLVQREVSPAIVALQVTATRSFMDNQAGAHAGTGFVVDAKLGLMLTNRHVCTVGPSRVTATFVGCPAMEEVTAHVVYADPIHDFALLRFDPRALEQTPPTEIILDPAGCRVGEEIRIIGNDSMEKLQILSGTIARIDRNSPELSGDYFDENSFYALAGSGTRGGSSGSPVLNRFGKAIALNAAAAPGTMHGFFLPLHRVARALTAVRSGSTVPRGSICTAFLYASFPECARLGVPRDFVQKSILGCKPPEGGTFSEFAPPGGMLKVHRCIPGTDAAAALQPGDVLLELDNKPCVDFVFLDQMLDDNVGKHVSVTVCRMGNRTELSLLVKDLHALIPHEFLELGLGVFHGVGYHTAQKYHVPLGGVYVAQAGFVFGEQLKSDAVIRELNGVACDDLESFESVLRQVPEKEYFNVTWMVPKSCQDRKARESVVKMQRQWYSFRAWSLDHSTRVWCPRRVEAMTALEEEPALTAASLEDEMDIPLAKRRKKAVETGAMVNVKNSICTVLFRTVQNFDMDLIIDEASMEGDVACLRGAGVIIDVEAGFVITNRSTVPQSLGDIEVTMGEVSMSAYVWFMHPTHSMVILRLVKPADLSRAKVATAAKFQHRTFEDGDKVDFVGLDAEGQCFHSEVTIQSVKLMDFPPHWPVRWTERNLEAVCLVDDPSNAKGGVLCDGDGNVQALYVCASAQGDGEIENFGYCLPSHTWMPIIEQLRAPESLGTNIVVPSLETAFGKVELQKLKRLPAKIRPSEEWLKKLRSSGSSCALKVRGITTKGPCDGLLSEGDILVAICGEVVTSVERVEAKTRELLAQSKQSSGLLEVQLTLLRRGRQQDVTVHVPLLGNDGSTRLLVWHGLVIREVPRALREFGPVQNGLHIAQTMLGSPAETGGIEGDIIVAVDGHPVPTLDALIELQQRQPNGGAQAAGIPCSGERCHLRLESMSLNGQRYMATIEPDPLFWPMSKLTQDKDGAWSCVEEESR